MDSLFYFGEDDELFGALHMPPSGSGGSAGAVICSPLGFDNLTSYRPLRVLATRLATAFGRPTLRFDWPATGDSAGDTADESLVPRSLAALERSVEELRIRTGVDAVALVGVGIGATLATVAAARGLLVSELVLWAPPVSGRAYVRQLRAFHSLSKDGASAASPVRPLPEGSFEATGAFFSAETTRDLAAIDLLELELDGLRAERALVLGRDGEKPSEALVARLLAAGIATTADVGSGADELVSNVTKLPEAVFGRIVEWLDPAEPRQPPEPPRATVRMRHSDGVEELIAIIDGSGERIVGVETTGTVNADASTWIVFPTTGVLRRAGPNRLWTRVARDLAARGLPSLRLDVHGAGDSGGPDTTATNLSTEYSPEVLASVRAALAHLRETRGATSFVLAGLCSGAFSSLRTAVDEQDVTGAMLINLEALFWTRDDEVRTQSTYLRESVLRGDRWREALRGRVNVVRVSAVLGRTLATATTRGAQRLRRMGSSTPRDTVGEAIEHTLGRLEKRGVPLLFVYTDDDPGIAYLDRHLGHGIDALLAHPNVRVEIVSGAGHTFNPLWSQDLLRDLLDEHLVDCGVGIEAAPSAPSA